MLKSQSIEVEKSQVREKLNTLPDDAAVEDINELTARYQTLEAQYRAAIIVEAEEVQQRGAEGQQGQDSGESAEIAKLLKRATVSGFVMASVSGQPVGGAEAEVRAALLGDNAPDNMMPLNMLLPPQQPVEHRADAATSVSTSYVESQASIMARIFSAGAGPYMGIQRPTVPVGTASYPVLTGGATGDARSPGVAKDAEAATFSVASVEPVRHTARYLFDMESTYRMRGLEEALAVDLRGAVEDELDRVALQGQAAVQNVSPAVEGIIGALADPTNPTDAVTATDVLDAYSGAVEGKYAANEDNVRMLVNPATYKATVNLVLGTNSGRLLRDVLPMGRFMASANMPAEASNVSTALLYLAPRRAFYQPIWQGLTLIRDPYTKAAEGQIALTAHVLANSKMADANAYRRLEFKTS